MKMAKSSSNFIIRRSQMNKWKKQLQAAAASLSSVKRCWEWMISSSSREDDSLIPGDVPRGHLAVYVGDDENKKLTRFVIKIALLNHPLLRVLLDDQYHQLDFITTYNSKLWIPCHQYLFVDALLKAAAA